MGVIEAGRLRHQVSLYSRTVSKDAAGQDSITWTLIATVWADRLPVRESERAAAGGTVEIAETKYRIRYRSDVNQRCRLVWNGLGHDIVSVLEVGYREGLDLLTLEGVKDGR